MKKNNQYSSNRKRAKSTKGKKNNIKRRRKKKEVDEKKKKEKKEEKEKEEGKRKEEKKKVKEKEEEEEEEEEEEWIIQRIYSGDLLEKEKKQQEWYFSLLHNTQLCIIQKETNLSKEYILGTFKVNLIGKTRSTPLIETTHHYHTTTIRRKAETLIETLINKCPRDITTNKSNTKTIMSTSSLPLSHSSTKSIIKKAQKSVRDELVKWIFEHLEKNGNGTFSLPTQFQYYKDIIINILSQVGINHESSIVNKALSSFVHTMKEIHADWKFQNDQKYLLYLKHPESYLEEVVNVINHPLKGKVKGLHQISLQYRKITLRINEEHYKKLQALFMFHRHLETLEVGSKEMLYFHKGVFSLLLRYQTLQGGGFQAAIPRPAFTVLSEHLGVQFECFASPLNCRFTRYCSLFTDTDAIFGSVGSFFKFSPESGSFQVNPPFSEATIACTVSHITNLLSKATSINSALSFVVIIPHWNTSEAWQSLVDHSFSTHEPLHISQRDTYYCEGMQHLRKEQYRKAQCDTSIFFLQTDIAKKKWPITKSLCFQLRQAFSNPNKSTIISKIPPPNIPPPKKESAIKIRKESVLQQGRNYKRNKKKKKKRKI